MLAGLSLMVCVLPQALARAQESTPLHLADVLRGLSDTHPVLQQAALGRKEAQAKRYGAQGAWDPLLQIDAKSVPAGYYKHELVSARVKQATPLWGADAYAGYSVGNGKFPVYKGDLETLSAGELRAGLELPLWKDRAIDGARAAIQAASARAEGAECAERATQLAVRRDAAIAYWNWIEAGLALDIQSDLLDVAKARVAGLEQQVELGSAPPIVSVDNMRLVLERRAKWVTAQRDFQRASLALSLYLRDSQLRPVSPGAERLVEVVPELDPVHHPADVVRAIKARPELCQLEREARAAGVELALADNQVAPSIDAHAYVARDFGRGPDNLAPTEFGVGLHFEMPLTLRKARGQIQAAQAKASAIAEKLRGLRDKVATQVHSARVDLDAAHQQVQIARAQKRAADLLAQAERDKLLEGASDLVVLNLREIAAAEAARAELAAHVALHKAHVDYRTATGQGI